MVDKIMLVIATFWMIGMVVTNAIAAIGWYRANRQLRTRRHEE